MTRRPKSKSPVVSGADGKQKYTRPQDTAKDALQQARTPPADWPARDLLENLYGPPRDPTKERP